MILLKKKLRNLLPGDQSRNQKVGQKRHYVESDPISLNERGAGEFDPSDGIPDYYNWASRLHAETFGESNP